MWYPAIVTVPPDSEPVSADQAKRQTRIDFDDDDVYLADLIAAGRDHAEKYCGLRLSPQTVSIACDRFDDLAHLSEAPVSAITSITYVDASGSVQTLPEDAYEVRLDSLVGSVVAKFGQLWPATQLGSRIIVTATVGFDVVPPALQRGIILLVAHWYENREPVVLGQTVADVPHSVDALFSNFRVGP